MTFTPPRQSRSRSSMERILDATTGLLQHTSFDRLTIHEIVTEADSSVGSFYARFGDKDALLAALYRRYLDESESAVLRLSTQWRAQPPRERIASICDFLVSRFFTHRAVIRSALLNLHLDSGGIASRFAPQILRIYASVHASIKGDGRGFRHARPDSAISFGLRLLVSTARETVVFGTPYFTRLEPRDLGRHLTDVLTRYLLDEEP